MFNATTVAQDYQDRVAYQFALAMITYNTI